MSFRVELTESATEAPRGFLGTEDDDNPNNNVKVAEFDSEDEAQRAIWAEIKLDMIAAREFAFTIIDDQGESYDVTYYDEVYKHWDTFS